MPYKKILVALDNSSLGKHVFEQSLVIAQQNGAALMLFHSLPLDQTNLKPYSSFYDEQLDEFSYLIREQLEKESEEVRQWLAEYGKKAKDQGVTTEWDWKIGEPGRWIRDLAKSWDADLIIMGRRGLKGISEMFLGSVSNYVVHHVNCSVLIVQGNEK
ncbi:MAG TPA: universal stress protein [Cyanothece sp. UBA12306]|nr:universal stress protein [Cyanothece sp. UBA12306]